MAYNQYSRIYQQSLLDAIYPVGSIYMSVTNTSPASFLGGTWEALKDRFLVGAGSSYAVNATGGESSHTLTKNEMPAHTHARGTMEITGSIKLAEQAYGGGASGAFSSTTHSQDGSGGFANNNSIKRAFNFQASNGWSGETSSVGSGGAHNNMPPYLAVYMWKRTA